LNDVGSVGDPTVSGDTTKTLNDYAVVYRDHGCDSTLAEACAWHDADIQGGGLVD